MNIGIVGSEAIKFTKLGEERAKEAIKHIATGWMSPPTIVSGECHLGGIDIWAKEYALANGLDYVGYPPRDLTWSGGFKPRNLQIAHNSSMIFCITVDKLPDEYTGMRFPGGCYHCIKSNAGFKEPHAKSGGCWTVLQGIKKGKEGKWVIIPNF
jgi:hypothetical protein